MWPASAGLACRPGAGRSHPRREARGGSPGRGRFLDRRWPGRAVVPQGPRWGAAEENGLQICAEEATGGFEGGLNKMSEGGNQVTSS